MTKTQIYREITARMPLGHRQKGVRLTSRDKIFILWCRSEGLAMSTISERLPAARSTVNAYLTRVRRSPRIALERGIYQRLNQNQFKCAFCGEIRANEPAIGRHVLAHFLPYEVARDTNLEGSGV